MTDPRPRPQYGEYADVVPPVPAAPEPEVEAPPPVVRRRFAWDLPLTTVLLLWGVFDVVTGFPQFARFGAAMAEAYEAQGWPDFTATELANQLGPWVNGVRVVLLLVAIVAALWLIARQRTAFWVPLAAGVLAALALLGVTVAIMLQDPAIAQMIDEMSTP